MKNKMLSWPFCTALIIGPASLAARVRGSAAQHELILAALSDMKPLLLSRSDASDELSKEYEEMDLDEGRSTSRISYNSAGSSKVGRKSRLDRLEQGQLELKNMFETFMTNFGAAPAQPAYESYSSDDFSDDHEDHPHSPKHHSPVLDEVSWSVPLSAPLLPINEVFDFNPKTKEQEPAMPAPKPAIAKQGTECQRLGESSFKLIRYSEVQKRLNAFPVFNALKINQELSHRTSNSDLARMDTTLGTLVHGLLLQREAFASAIQDLTLKHPNIKADIVGAFSPESSFRCISDDVLQYACGRRAEVIEQRRNLFLPKDPLRASLMDAIPPSTTHLFCEKEFSDLMKQQPGPSSFFRPSGGEYRSNTKRYSYPQRKFPQTQKRPPFKKSDKMPEARRRQSEDVPRRKRQLPASRSNSRSQPKLRKPNFP